MGFLKDIFIARRYRKKETVTPDEFLEGLRCHYGKNIDTNSSFFFRHHPLAVDIVHKIITGRLKKTNNNTKDDVIIKALLLSMLEYTPKAASLDINSQNIISDVVAEFSKDYEQAGNIIGQALITFLK
jgi:hypothetical protein